MERIREGSEFCEVEDDVMSKKMVKQFDMKYGLSLG